MYLLAIAFQETSWYISIYQNVIVLKKDKKTQQCLIYRVYFYQSTCQEVSCATGHDQELWFLPSSYPTMLSFHVPLNKRKSQNTLLLKLFPLLLLFFLPFERGLSTTYIPLINKTTSHLTTLATREAEAMTWFKFPVSFSRERQGRKGL